MRLPFLSMFMTSPFDGMQEHAEVVKDCAWAFQEAVECHISYKCSRFDSLRGDIIEMEREADAIKRRIRGHIPKGTLMPVDKFQLFRYLREQDSVLDSVEHALDWLSLRPDEKIPKDLQTDIFIWWKQWWTPLMNLAAWWWKPENIFGIIRTVSVSSSRISFAPCDSRNGKPIVWSTP